MNLIKRSSRARHAMAGLCVLAILGGCATSVTSVATDLVLNAIGIKKDQGPPPPKNITLLVHTADNLNADSQGRGLSAILRIYKLKDAAAFNQATLDALNEPDTAKQKLGQDIVESKEQLLIPGQHYQFKEKVDAQNGYLAIAVLFRNPSPQRWKLIATNADLKENEPIIIGAHACALTVTSGWPNKNELESKYLLSMARCQ